MNYTKTSATIGGSGLIGAVIGMILVSEGGYVNHPSDPGGETNYGITEQVARNAGYTGSMVDMPIGTAIDIYAKEYITAPGFLLVAEQSEPVGAKVIDAGVNVGVTRVSMWYQQSLNNFSRGCRDYPCIVVDGKIGPATIQAHTGLINSRGPEAACKLLLRALDSYQGNHYMSLTKLSEFNVGWFLNRINNVSEDECNVPK